MNAGVPRRLRHLPRGPSRNDVTSHPIFGDLLKNRVLEGPTEKPNALPSCPGVYILTCPRDGVLYIGQSENLRKRWIGHIYRDLLDVPTVTIWWIVCDDRFSLETNLIRVSNPRFNGSSSLRASAWRREMLGLPDSRTRLTWQNEGPILAKMREIHRLYREIERLQDQESRDWHRAREAKLGGTDD